MNSLLSKEIKFDQISEWEGALTDSFVPLSIRAGQQRFCASLSSRRFEQICLSVVSSVAHHCSHEIRHSRRDHDDCYLLSMQLNGTGSLHQDNRSACVNPGDMVFYDSTRPFDWSFDTNFRQLVVRLPRESFRYQLSAPQECTARKIDSRQGMGRLVGNFLGSIIEESGTLSADAGRCVASSTVDLLAGMLSEFVLSNSGSKTNIQKFHLSRAFAYIEENIGRSSLSPEEIAHALNISVRYLHRLFMSTELSVGRHILQSRLEGCAAHLRDPRRAVQSISSIAYEWGFDNSAHFSRSFRTRFRLSAREYRAEKLTASQD
jgi:AraC-like DNA-binding protein